MAKELMTVAEIHDFGIEVVFNFIKTEGHEAVSVNTDVGVNPQIIAKKNGQLEYIVVRTACYPFKGQIESDQIAFQCIEHADNVNATCYFASVGIANADGKNDAEMALPRKGSGFHVAFEGLAILTRTDRAKVARRT